MKKEYNLKKHKKRIKAMEPSSLQIATAFISIALFYIAVDLNLEKTKEFASTLFILEIAYIFCWVIDSLIYAIIKKKKNKKKVEQKHE